MPITSRQFDLGIDAEIAALIDRAQQFLKQYAKLAYSEEELSEVLACGKDATSREALAKALEVLADFEVLEKRWVGNIAYYKYHGEPVEPLA
jgi:hypothetical protein